MITKEARVRRKRCEAELERLRRAELPWSPQMMGLSQDLWDELFDHCRPTRREFKHLTSDIIVTADSYYRMFEVWPRWKR